MARASGTAEAQATNGLDASGTPVNLMAFINVNTADPGTTGASEMVSSTRQAMTWNAGNTSTGIKTNSGTATLTTPGTVAGTFFSTWSASTAGTYGIGGALTSSVTAVTITVAAGALSVTAS